MNTIIVTAIFLLQYIYICLLCLDFNLNKQYTFTHLFILNGIPNKILSELDIDLKKFVESWHYYE